MSSKYKPFILWTVITFIFAGLGGIVTYFGMPAFESANQPALTPPSFIFPIVWGILFLLMAVGASIITKSNNQNRSSALFLYVIQLIANFLWCVFFFGFHSYLLAFIWLICLWTLVLFMMISFYKINHIAGLIQIPYLIWLTFAAYLNFMVWFLNR